MSSPLASSPASHVVWKEHQHSAPVPLNEKWTYPQSFPGCCNDACITACSSEQAMPDNLTLAHFFPLWREVFGADLESIC